MKAIVYTKYGSPDVLQRLNAAGAPQTHKLEFWVKTNVNHFMPFLKEE
jgi:hypothetical protein